MIDPTRSGEPETPLATLPLFPLHTVLLPGVPLPLHIFEPRYRQLITDLINETVPDRLFGVVAIRNRPVDDVENLDQVHAVGCTARLREAIHSDDGRYDVIVTGHQRFRLLDIDPHRAPYLTATVEQVDDAPLPTDPGHTTSELETLARNAHRRYCSVAWENESWHDPPADAGLAELAYFLADDCLLPLHERQALLEQRHPWHRLRMIHEMLSREAGILSMFRAIPVPHTDLDEAMARKSWN